MKSDPTLSSAADSAVDAGRRNVLKAGGGLVIGFRWLAGSKALAFATPTPQPGDAAMARADGNLAIGVDARTRGFDAGQVVAALDTLRADPALRPELIYTVASDTVLLRRYTESRRRHPLAPQGLVADGIASSTQLCEASIMDDPSCCIGKPPSHNPTTPAAPRQNKIGRAHV